ECESCISAFRRNTKFLNSRTAGRFPFRRWRNLARPGPFACSTREPRSCAMQHLLQRLTWPEHLSEGEQNRLIESVSHIQSFNPGDESVAAHKAVDFSSIILEGFSCRQKVLKTGSRQITAFNLPGDFCDLHAYMLRTLPDSAIAITACRVAIVPH